MTQRIFDVENEKDMQDLWDILPDGIIKISPNNLAEETSLWSELNLFTLPIGLIKINWHGKTEIFRPLQEATEADAGKLCYFWDDDETIAYGLLSEVIIKERKSLKYGCCEGRRWTHARRLTKQEIEELC
ncbi:MAG: hypothetical protein IJ077_08625 [Eubacterium sp.]|nr:hypothetical protein [Alphaproteobacteria bacterium]MBQ8981657.1 hypothetical protein [Eubacterium sp.]